MTTINLEHIYYTGLSGSNPNQPHRRPESTQRWTQATTRWTQPTTRWTQPTTRYTQAPTRQPASQAIPISNYSDEDFECGITSYHTPSSIGLVVGGHTAVRGQFPWQV